MKNLRSKGVAASFLVAIALSLSQFNSHAPVADWLVWRYMLYWLAVGLLGISTIAGGHRLVQLIAPYRAPLGEHLAISFGVGVYIFGIGQFLIGLSGGLGPIVSIAWPALLFAWGGPSLFRLLRRTRRHRARFLRRPFALHEQLAVGFGIAVLILLYSQIITPENVGFDAACKHLALAEHYAAAGGIERSPEGWYVATYPHFASLLYSWAFTLPGAQVFDQIEIALHIEFALFVGTLLAIGPTVRRLVPRPVPRAVWAARLLFPGVLLYDSNLNGGADHIAAFFALPAFLCLLRAWRTANPRWIILTGLLLSGSLLTKYTAAHMLVLLPGTVIALRGLYLGMRGARRALLTPLVIVGAGLFFTSPHWLKNMVWYGDPAYPMLHAHLTLTPWSDGAADTFEYGYKTQSWQPEANTEGLINSLSVLATFSFLPNDWGRLHGTWPVFGSLFTLLLLGLPWIRRTRRLWGLVGLVHGGIFAWFWVHHQDRYLQALMPLIAAATAALLVRFWRLGGPARWSMAGLVALQIIWGADVFFIDAHTWKNGSTIKASLALIKGGYTQPEDRLDRPLGSILPINRALPDDARVLLHDLKLALGIGAPTVNEHWGWQGGIDFGGFESPAQVHDALVSMGVTHVLWTQKWSNWATIAHDLVFAGYLVRHTQKWRRFNHFRLSEVGARPAEVPFGAALYLGCNNRFKDGLYQLADMRQPMFGPHHQDYPTPRKTGPASQLIHDAEFVVLQNGCNQSVPSQARFTQARKGRRWQLWVRRR